VYMLFCTELPTGAFIYSILSIPTICMSRADQRVKATRNIASKLPELLTALHQISNPKWVCLLWVLCVVLYDVLGAREPSRHSRTAEKRCPQRTNLGKPAKQYLRSSAITLHVCF
jgi:hypothetical protein